MDDDLLRSLADRLGLPVESTRRGFLKAGAVSVAGMSMLGALAARAGTVPYVIVQNADGMLIADPTRCVGCKRCELACTELNDGRAQPSLARIKVSRNHNFGARGQRAGFGRGDGVFGNLRLVQDTCLQCPHPVPCATACPSQAIVLEPKTHARMVDRALCAGCRTCLRSCPWEMFSFDDAAGKATKCFLCAGQPACVEACPALALLYVPWRDLTKAVPTRQASMPVDMTAPGCGSCHPIKRGR